jgi:tetratricopeptide (TPR) repeat protein
MISENKARLLALFAEGRAYYKQGDFAKAGEYFAGALKIDPEDGPSKVYVERCRDLAENPPPADWDGVYVMKTK